jgi:hypothetical protein
MCQALSLKPFPALGLDVFRLPLPQQVNNPLALGLPPIFFGSPFGFALGGDPTRDRPRQCSEIKRHGSPSSDYTRPRLPELIGSDHAGSWLPEAGRDVRLLLSPTERARSHQRR